MARREGADAIYALADRLREHSLRTGESLLWPGERVWSPEVLEEVARAFLDSPDTGDRSFFEKLKDQLDGRSEPVLKTAADINLIYHLFPSNMGYGVKRKNLELVASWAAPNFEVPENVDIALRQRIGSPGMHYLVARPQQWGFYCYCLAELLRRDAPLSEEVVREVADDVQAKVRGSGEARNIVLHLLYPDTFERIASDAKKRRIVTAFQTLAESDDPEIALGQIRQRLETERGGAIDFYDTAIKEIWDSKNNEPKRTRTPSDERWLVGAAGPPGRWASELADIRERLAAHGRTTVWFSFPLQEDHQAILKASKALYLYTSSPVSKVTHRFTVHDFRTLAGPDGMESPWPEVTASDEVGRTRRGPRMNEIFKTWLLVEAIDDLDPPMEAQHFERAGGQPAVPSSLLNGFGVWQPKSAGSNERWAEFIRWARHFREHPNFDATERDYKLEVAARMDAARQTLGASDPSWQGLLKEAFGPVNNLTPWRQARTFLRLVEASPDDAGLALLGLWDEEATETERVDAFTEMLPNVELSGAAGEANLASVLLMAMGAEVHPPFQASRLAGGFKLTGFRPPDADASAAERYAHAFDFYDSMLEVARENGLDLRDRLDAQSVLWSVLQTPLSEPPISEWDEDLRQRFIAYREGSGSVAVAEAASSDWGAVANRCYMDEGEVRGIVAQLQRRRQLVFYGPPGTGKTYVAQEIAKAFVAESGGRYQLIQFHPSYSYEDFVEGLKPRLRDGSIEYAVEPGILRELAAEAAEAPNQRFVLIVDEMNRANLAKVFGELFFLLEYRASTARLPYSKDDFSLPPNLFLIGTMNTADRSIAVVDFALRRRFGFVPFFPDRNQPVLRGYLLQHAPDLLFVADMLSRLNEWIGDKNYMLGHSYFMPSDPGALDEDYLRDVWRYSIEPHLEEYWYDEPGQLSKCRFDALRQAVVGADDDGGGGT